MFNINEEINLIDLLLCRIFRKMYFNVETPCFTRTFSLAEAECVVVSIHYWFRSSGGCLF